MNKFKFIIPCDGAIIINIDADSVEEAYNILEESKEDYENIPFGKLDLHLTEATVMVTKPKLIN